MSKHLTRRHTSHNYSPIKKFQIEEIKQNLIQSCINLNAFHFLPYLLSPLVQIDFPNKIRFYRFLKYLLETAKEESVGYLELKIEAGPSEEDEEIKSYNFYDQVHKYPRLNVQVKEERENIFIDLKPF